MAKHLIMGFATNQKSESLEVFLRSARSIYPTDTCDIALIMNTTEGLEDLIAETSCLVVNTPSTYSRKMTRMTKLWDRTFLHALRLMWRVGLFRNSPEMLTGYFQLIETWHHPHFARWFAYQRVLATMTGYDRILLADTKDVVFQAPFFDRIDPEAVAIFEDGEKFVPEGWNARWYIDAYGEEAYRKVADRNPICIGVVAGGPAPLRRFITELCDSIAESPFKKIEQAIFNKMHMNGEFTPRFEVFPNMTGPTATLAFSAEEATQRVQAQDNGLLYDRQTGQILPVVHMYDRFKDLDAVVRGRWI